MNQWPVRSFSGNKWCCTLGSFSVELLTQTEKKLEKRIESKRKRKKEEEKAEEELGV